MVFSNNLLTPTSLWGDFDDGLPLKEAVVSKIKVDNAVLSEVYFSGRAVGSERVRIYGFFASPETDGLKGAILYLAGENEKIGFDSIKEFVSLGFSVLAVDIYGKREGTVNYTEYPESISYANLTGAGDRKDRVDDSAKETCWYEWVAVARYAVKYLKSLGYERVGVIGDKTGANVGWQEVAFDKNVDCFVALFGAGWTAYKNEYKYSDTENNDRVETDESYLKYVAAVEAHAYAPYVKCPVLYLTSTNSEFFEFDRSGDTLSRLNAEIPCYYNYAIGYNVHLDSGCKNDLVAFLYCYLIGEGEKFPDSPELEIEEKDGKAVFTVTVEERGLKHLRIFINEGVVASPHRSWNEYIPNSIDTRKYSFVLDGVNDSMIFAFCCAEYENGTVLSSKEIFKKLESVKICKSSKLIYSDREDFNGLCFMDGEADAPLSDVFVNKTIEKVMGANGISGVYSPDGLISYGLARSGFGLNENSILKLDVYAPEFCPLILSLYESTEDGSVKKYDYSQDFKAEDLWRNLLIKITDFKSDIGLGIKSYDKVFALSIYSESRFAVNNILVI